VKRVMYRLLPAAVFAVILIGLSIGPVPISLFAMSATDQEIVFNLRLPRVLSAFLVGGGLALAGAIFGGRRCFQKIAAFPGTDRTGT